MRSKIWVAGVCASAMSAQPVLAQGSVSLPSDRAAIAREAADDLRDGRFYNRPGATRADYQAEWQECREIARGSRTPAGHIPVYYQVPGVSPVAGAIGAGIGAGIAGAIMGAIAAAQQRRANRRACLMIRGWRRVELPQAEEARVRAMNDEQRSAYFDRIVGAEQVEGTVTERTNFSLVPDPALRLDAPIEGEGTIFLGRRVDPAVPFELAPGEGAVIVAFRRPDEGSAGRAGEILLARYDVEARDLHYRPRDWRRTGDMTTYNLSARSRDRSVPLEVHVLRVTPGDYVIAGHQPGALPVTNSFCFGAPTFHVAAGQVVYVGDFTPYVRVPLSTGERLSTMAYGSHIEDARRTLAASQPALAQALMPATLRNGATFSCAAVTMDRWDIAGLETLAPPSAPSAVAGSRTTEPATNAAERPAEEAQPVAAPSGGY